MVLALRVDGCSGAGGAVELMSCSAFRAWRGQGQGEVGAMFRAKAEEGMADVGISAKLHLQS